MLYVGIDLGTSAVKLLLMNEKGEIQKIVSKEYPLYFPHPGWSEQNPEDWFTQSVEGMKELTEGIDRSQVAGIGFGGQMHGLVTLDENDNVIRPAILWNDGRSQKETEYLNNEIGKDKLSQYTANIAFAGFTNTPTGRISGSSSFTSSLTSSAVTLRKLLGNSMINPQ